MAYLREIADALADSLDSVSWTPGTTAVYRRNWAAVDVDDMAEPVIFVTPGGAEVSRVGRTTTQTDYSADVFIGRHVQSDAEVDGMIDLADAVMLYIRAHDWTGITWPTGVTKPQALSIELNPDDALNDRNVWRAVITVTYRVFEADALPEV
jgi:hypothetical protein